MQAIEEEKPEVVVDEEAAKAVTPDGESVEEVIAFLRLYEEAKWKRFTKGKDLFNTVPNTEDTRSMCPLPYYVKADSKTHLLYSHNHKMLGLLYGSDDRLKHCHQMPTKGQRVAHAHYIKHACNSFPRMQTALEKIYQCEDMPEEAIKIIETLMLDTYYEEVPEYAR